MNYLLERFMVITGEFLHTHDNIPVHLDEAPVTVPGKAFIPSGSRKSGDGPIVEAQIENRVHHAGHRVAGTRAH